MVMYTILLVLFVLTVIKSARVVQGEYSETYLSLNNAQWLKGAAALLIVFHHLPLIMTLPSFYSIMGYIGFISVGVFFFLSGYGLMYGLAHKESYLDGFLKKKVFRLYLPYWVVITAVVILRATNGTVYNVKDYILTYLGFDRITGLWFVIAIILMYAFFWFSYRISMKHGLLILIGLIILYCICCFSLDLNSSYTASIFAFVFGVAWSRIEELWKQWVRRYYPIKLLLTVIAFAILFTGRLALAVIGIDNELLHLVLRNIISITFVMLLMTITQKIEFKQGIIFKVGTISYELYLVHCVLLSILTASVVRQNLYVGIVVIGAVVISIGLHQVCVRIEKRTFRGSHCGSQQNDR